jgi:hypothetical protein
LRARGGNDEIGFLMAFRILGEIAAVETIASWSGIREIARLRKLYGRRRWRKRKGIADIQLKNGRIRQGRDSLV